MKAKTRRKIEAQKRAERIAAMTAEYVGQVKRCSRKDGTDRVVYRTSTGGFGAMPATNDAELSSSTVIAFVPAKGRVQWNREG